MPETYTKNKINKLTDTNGIIINPATETTLTLIKTKTDNLDIALSGIKTGTDKIISTPSTEAKQDDIITELEKKADLTETQPVAIEQVYGDISVNNSTTTTLGSGGVFTGVSDEVVNYKSIGILIKASHVSATNGLNFQFSTDNNNWDKLHTFTLPAATAKFYNIPVEARYFRIVYTNSANIQTYFRVQTIYHATTTKESTLRLGEDIDSETASQLSRSVISGEKPSGDFTNVQVTTNGNLKVSIEEQDPGAGMATEAKQDDIITAINTISGLQISTDMEGGGKNAVGIVAAEVTFTGTTKSIILSADSSNTGELYIGKSNVTSAGANAITFLLPGESVEMSYNDATNPIYIVASVAAQNFYKGALL